MADGKQRRGAHAIDVVVGSNIRTARFAKGLSQEALGKTMDLTFQQVQKYEKGTNRVSAGRLLQIADALDVDVPWLLTDHERAAGGKITPLKRADGHTHSMFADRDVVKLAGILFGIQDRAARFAIIDIAQTISKFANGKSNGKRP